MIVDGTSASERLNGTSSDDVITGLGGNDTMNGGDGNDTYVVSGAFGRDDILDPSGTDRIQVGTDYAPSSFRLVHPRFGNDLIIQQVDGDNSITLTNYFNPSTSVRGNIETVAFSSTGTVWNLADGSVFRTVGFTGTNDSETILATNGNDFVNGIGGNDNLTAGDGNDTYYFSGAFGNDTISDTSGADLVIIDSDYTEAFFRLAGQRFGDDLIMQQVNGGNSINFSNYYGNAQKVETVYFIATGTKWDLSTGSLVVTPGAFDYNGYLSANADIRAAGLDAYSHYVSSGWREARDPSVSFDTTLYLLRNPDVAATGINPLQHFLTAGQFEGRAAHSAVGSGIDHGFDAEYYLLANPDIGLAGANAAQHYASSGWHEGRNPNYLFDTKFYLTNNPDVAASGMNPLMHYDLSGWREGRDPSAGFRTAAYLAANPDVAAAQIDPMQHYLQSGVYEGRPLG